jgi:hypothetical protein
MTRKLFHITGILLIVATLWGSMPARANSGPQIIDPKKAPIPVYLRCTWNGPKEFPRITVTNNTSDTIAQGKSISWSVNPQTKGAITLQYALAPGRQVSRDVELHGSAPYDPRAWYVK